MHDIDSMRRKHSLDLYYNHLYAIRTSNQTSELLRFGGFSILIERYGHVVLYCLCHAFGEFKARFLYIYLWKGRGTERDREGQREIRRESELQ